MRWVIAIGVLVGCGPSSALEIVVAMPPGDVRVDQVQLYVGLGSPQNEHGTPELLVPRDYVYPDRPDGYYWKRDPGGGQDVVDVAPGATEVRFAFHEGSHDRMTVIVVGSSAGKIVAATSLVDASLEAGSVRQYHVQLAPAAAAFPRPAPSPVTVHRWGPGPGDTQCAYLENPMAGDRSSIFVVEHDDRDCDGVIFDDDPETNLECLPEVHLGTERPERDQLRCLRTDMIPNAGADGTACVLGGGGCVDGRGHGACDASTTCATQGACTACGGRSDALDCLANLPLMNAAATRIECTFFTVPTNAALCPGTAVLTQPFQFLPMCDVDRPYLFWLTGQDKWNPQSLTKNGVTFTAAKPTTNCDFKLTATGIPTVGAIESFRSIVNLQIGNGRSAALPLAITIQTVTDCAEPIATNACKVAGDPLPGAAFTACMSSRVVEPW